MLYYVTSVHIPAVNAQSVQILANCKAFSNLLGEGFKLISVKNNENFAMQDIWWKKIPCIFNGGRFKYLEFSLKCLFLKLEKNSTIYTRDILIAFLFSLKGFDVVYEAHQKPSRKATFIIKKLLTRGLKCVCISKALTNYYVGFFSLNENDVLTAHDGVFIEEYKKTNMIDIRKKYSIKSDFKILLHSGSIYLGRGAELFAPILKEFDSVVIFHVGGDLGKIDFWKNEINSDRFIAIPHVSNSELIQLQKSADYLLYPMTRKTKTYWCCSPMKMFEYMAANKPIISTNVGAIKEVLHEGNSFPFDPESTSQLFDAINKCIKDELLSKKKAEQAYNDVCEHYSWEKRVEKILKFLTKNH